jgi:CBS domain-containing protein
MTRARTTKRLTVRDIMSSEIVTVEPEDTLREAVDTLATYRVTGAPVMSSGTLVGVISKTDILDFLASTPAVPTTTPQFAEWGEFENEDEDAELDEQSSSFYTDLWEDAGADVVERFAESNGPEWDLLGETTVSAVMTRKLQALPPHATIQAAARRLLTAGVHRLLVIDQGKLAGVLSMTDLVRLIARRAIA